MPEPPSLFRPHWVYDIDCRHGSAKKHTCHAVRFINGGTHRIRCAFAARDFAKSALIVKHGTPTVHEQMYAAELLSQQLRW